MRELFNKQDLLSSRKYNKYKDILETILDENKLYSIKEVEKLINDFLKKGV